MGLIGRDPSWGLNSSYCYDLVSRRMKSEKLEEKRFKVDIIKGHPCRKKIQILLWKFMDAPSMNTWKIILTIKLHDGCSGHSRTYSEVIVVTSKFPPLEIYTLIPVILLLSKLSGSSSSGMSFRSHALPWPSLSKGQLVFSEVCYSF